MPKDKPKSKKRARVTNAKCHTKAKATARLDVQSPVQPRGMAGRVQGITLVTDGNGRPTNLTPEVHEAFIADMLTHADWPAMTAYRVGVSPVTVESWLTRGCDPLAVEPYRSFAADFVAAEASVHGELVAIILDAAKGGRRVSFARGAKTNPNPAWAAWLLQHRWGYLWRLNKDTGRTRGFAVAEVVDQALARFSEARREKAKAIIAQLSQEARASARAEGFML